MRSFVAVAVSSFLSLSAFAQPATGPADSPEVAGARAALGQFLQALLTNDEVRLREAFAGTDETFEILRIGSRYMAARVKLR